MIKKIGLTGTEQAVTFAGTHTHYWVQNLGGGTVLAGLEPELAEGKDDVLIVPSGGVGYIRFDKGAKTVYLSGTGKVQVYGTNNAFCPFKSAPKGGDEIISEGGTITAATVDYPLIFLNLYGNSTQDGTPTPEDPVQINSIGDDVAININSCGKNLLNIRDDLPITVSGVTISRDNIGNIILNGTATATISVSLSTIDLPYNTYTMSIDSKIEGVGISCTDFGSIFLASTKNSVTIENSGSGNLRLNISPNIVLENFVLNPQIELGTTATEYEPYTGNTAIITSGLPLCSVGDVCDELIYNADGTGKIIKRTRKTLLSSQYNWTMSANPARFGYAAGITGADISSGYASAISEFFSDCRLYSTWVDIFTDYFADLDEFKEFLDNNDVYLIYPLATPEIIELSSAEMVALRTLQTFEGVTNIFNDEGAKMRIKVAANPLLSEYVMPVLEGITARYEARIAALESAIANN